MRFLLFSWMALVCCVMVSCDQAIPLWSGQDVPRDLLRPFFLDSASNSMESPDYENSQKQHPVYSARQSAAGGLKKRVAMGVDLPDYILHYRGNKSPDLGSFRERMQLSGRR